MQCKLHLSLLNYTNPFFSKDGMIYGTNEGSVCWRNFDKNPVQDTKAIMFENFEKIKYIELLCVSILSDNLNTLVAVG